MRNHIHFIVMCRQCKIVISQCRCAEKNKVETYELCNKCVLEKIVVDDFDLSDLKS